MYNGQTATILAGQRGYDGSENFEAVPYDALITAKNIRFDGSAWVKAPGLTKYDSNAIANTPTCVAGIDYQATSSTQRLVTVWSNGKCFKEVSGDVDNVEAFTGVTISAPVVLVECGNEIPGNAKKLLFFSGGIIPRVASGDVTAGNFGAISNPSADWSGSNYPTGAVMHDARVVAWGNANSQHTLYFSTLADHSDFLTDLPPVIDVMPGEGDYIAACASMLSTRLYVFKFPAGIYWIDTTNITSYLIPVTTVRRDIGMAGPNAITKVGGLGTWFIGSDGHIYSLESVENPDIDLKDASITGQLNLSQWIKDNVAPAYLKYARLLYDPNRKEVWAMYTSSTGTSNNIGFVIDVSKPGQPRIATEERGTYFNAMWLMKESTTRREIFCGGTGGLVYKANQSDRSISNTAYDCELQLPDSDLSWVNPALSTVNKRLDWIEIILTATGDYELGVEVHVDGVAHSTYDVNMGAAGSVLDTGVLDAFVLGYDGQLRRRVKVGAVGQRFGLKLYNNSASQNFKVSKINYQFAPLGSLGEM